MNKIQKAQTYLQERGFDGWLLYDFASCNSLLYLFLEIAPEKTFRRRCFYWIPKEGEPIKIVHAIESHVFDAWPGRREVYASWQTLQEALQKVLKGKRRVAMEYSPQNQIPYVSKVDGGTLDLIRSFGIEVVSSADFLPYFTAVLDSAQAESHRRAGKALDEIVAAVWDWIGKRLGKVSEYDAAQEILALFERKGMESDSLPNVSVNAHSADPHYLPTPKGASLIRPGDFILIDMWGKEKEARSVFADITRVGVAAPHPSRKQQEIFTIVRAAQKAATDLVIRRFQEKKPLAGFEVDDAARAVITQAGFGPQFTHRTGHNIGVELHGSGAHMDNLEMHDVRPILPSTCFSIEPGIYLEGEFGVRLEYDLYVDPRGHVEITGGIQEEMVTLG